MKTSFSGHEKFDCKMSWLPLASKNIKAVYEDVETAISITGIGSNKIKSLKQWLGKLQLSAGTKFSSNAEIIFSNDPYLEKLESLWILHTYITQNFEKATLYNLFFNEFFISTFTKDALLERTKEWCENKGLKMADNTLTSDITVLMKMYLKDEKSNSLFSDLHLLSKVDNEYIFNVKNPAEVTDITFLYIFLYFIRDINDNTISVKDLQFGKTSLQYTLGLTEEKLLEKLENLHSVSNGAISYQKASGIKQIYITNRPKLEEILANVYK